MSDTVRIEAPPAYRRGVTVMQGLLGLLVLGLVWAGARVLGLLWVDRADPEVGRTIQVLVGILALAGVTLGWLIVLLQDLVKIVIDVGDEGLRVERLVRPFAARWDEVREVGLVPARGHLTLRTARGTLTTTARLLGPAPFGDLVTVIRARAGAAVREWTPWAGTRRQLLLLLGPALAAGLTVLLGQGLWRRPSWGRR